MDLLEIRKKAKEKKEAEKKAALKAEKEAVRQEEQGAEVKPAPAPRRPSKKKKPKASGEKAAKRTSKIKPAAAKAQEPAAPSVEREEPAAIPVPEAEAAAAPEAPAAKQPPAEEPAAAKEVSEEELPVTEASAGEEAPEHGGEDEDVDLGGSVIEYLAFMLADEEYAVKVEDVKEIIRLQSTTRVPRAEDFVEGIISLRGVIIPVFDIRKRLGLEQTEHGRTARIVIVAEDGSPQGIIVDKVTGVARLMENAIEPPPAVIGGVEAEYLEGVGRIGERLLILFNTGKVLAMDKETGS